jgi:hypothetical protein
MRFMLKLVFYRYKGGKIEGVNLQRLEDEPLTAASTYNSRPS